MRLNSKMLHKIGMSALSPNWLKMWCLRGIFRNIQRSIENLPADQRARFDAAATKNGEMRA